MASVLGVVGGQDGIPSQHPMLAVQTHQGIREGQQDSLRHSLRSAPVEKEGLADVQTPDTLVAQTLVAGGDTAPTGALVVTPILEHESGAGGLGQSYEAVARLIRSYDWDDEEALAVARCESGDDLYAAPEENWNHRGPFQASYVHKPRYERRGWDWSTATPAQHIEIAYELFLEQSWVPWACQP